MRVQLNAVSIKSGLFVFFILSIFLLSGCLNNNNVEDPISPEEFLQNAIQDVDQTRLASDLTIIDDSLDMWDITPSIFIEPKGVRYTIDEAGPVDAVKPSLSNIIKFKYTGKLLSTREVFDTSDNAADKFVESYLYNLIIGFQTTLPLLTKGTKATLYIPSGYGYGPSDRTNGSGVVVIPKNSNLIFEIELLDVR
jgi:FKBP-type peptidyl-prolyl cis-trans isomerase FkpA